MQKYVVGIVFCGEQVLFVRKNRPAWQAGGLNGVGGKVKNSENFYDAMIRECSEESNLVLTHWIYLGMLTDNINYDVRYYKAVAPSFSIAHSNTDEQINIYRIDDVDYSMLIPPTDIFLRLALHNNYKSLDLIVEG